ncbi:hypothetical protein PV326_012730, partial [Microctonus aethiopoides]
ALHGPDMYEVSGANINPMVSAMIGPIRVAYISPMIGQWSIISSKIYVRYYILLTGSVGSASVSVLAVRRIRVQIPPQETYFSAYRSNGYEGIKGIGKSLFRADEEQLRYSKEQKGLM